MPWSVIVRVPRSPEPDVAKYLMQLDSMTAGEVAQPALGDPQYTYTIPADGTYALSAIAVDNAGNKSNASPALSVVLDQKAPAAPGKLVLVSATWVP